MIKGRRCLKRREETMNDKSRVIGPRFAIASAPW